MGGCVVAKLFSRKMFYLKLKLYKLNVYTLAFIKILENHDMFMTLMFC